jgi:uncharacterized lipoprotein YddW (UPF0748 family)
MILRTVISLLLGSTVCLAQTIAAQNPLIELRGIWLVSNDLSQPPAELAKMLDAFASANFNTIFIDVWFRGYAAYPDSKIAPQYPALRGHDVIGFLVDECHKRHLRRICG